MSSDWTSADLDCLRTLDSNGLSPAEIATRMGREEADIQDRLAIIRARAAGPSGPDEEGETPLGSEALGDDPAAWVHVGDRPDDERPVHQTPPPPD